MTTFDVLLMEWKTLVSLSIFTIGMIIVIIWVATGGIDGRSDYSSQVQGKNKP